MFKIIVVGCDGSEESRRAVGWAANLATLSGGQLHVVAVARPPEIADDVETEALIQRMRAHYRGLLHQVKAELGLPEERVAAHVVVGHPAERLLRFAAEQRADHLVVGHRSRNELRQWLTGSVARQVIDHASCSVTIVR